VSNRNKELGLGWVWGEFSVAFWVCARVCKNLSFASNALAVTSRCIKRTRFNDIATVAGRTRSLKLRAVDESLCFWRRLADRYDLTSHYTRWSRPQPSRLVTILFRGPCLGAPVCMRLEDERLSTLSHPSPSRSTPPTVFVWRFLSRWWLGSLYNGSASN